MRILFSFTFVCLMTSQSLADWRQFRGNDTTSIASSPVENWSGQQSVAWKSSLPGRGLGSPVIIGDKVFLTASSGPRQERLHVLCLSNTDGKLLWERTTWATGRTGCHQKTCVAAPSPASDGKYIVGFYSSNDVVCYDLEGQLIWFRGLTYDFPNASNSLGMASSPVIVGETAIIMVECDDQSFSCGLDMQTGETRWQIERPRKANWTSPSISADGKSVLLQSTAGVSAIDPATGQELWTYSEGASSTPTLVVSGDVAYVPSNGITALRPSDSSSKQPEILWKEGSLSPSTASPVVANNQLFVVNRGGVLTCASLKDGHREWQARLEGGASASPVIAGGKLVYVNEEGLLQIVDLQNEGAVVSTQELSETILSTPSVDGKAIYVRSDGHLWKLSMD